MLVLFIMVEKMSGRLGSGNKLKFKIASLTAYIQNKPLVCRVLI